MKKITLISLLLLIGHVGYTQITYVSANNKKSDWTATSTWTRLPASATWAPATPGNPTNTNSDAINIYGYVRSETSLTVNNANPVITIYDTLFIVGNLTLGSGASMNIPAGGVLVVTGNLTLQGSFNMTNGGNVVVKGNLNVTNGQVTNNTNFYVFGPSSISGGGKVNGCNGSGSPGGCTAVSAGHIGNAANLSSNNSSLYNFVNNNGIVMPIDLIYFKISEITTSEVSLSWATSSESDFQHFVIERSNGIIFSEIGIVKGAGYNTEDVQKYVFTDSNPIIGDNYYRLKAVDLDGSYEYFDIRLATVTAPLEFSVFPNPSVDGKVGFKINFEPTEESTVKIFDNTGFQVRSLEVRVIEGELSFSEPLKSGIYYVQYLSKQFNQTVRVIVR